MNSTNKELAVFFHRSDKINLHLTIFGVREMYS